MDFFINSNEVKNEICGYEKILNNDEKIVCYKNNKYVFYGEFFKKNSNIERIVIFCRAFFYTLISGGLALFFSKKIKDDWNQVFSSRKIKSIFVRKEELPNNNIPSAEDSSPNHQNSSKNLEIIPYSPPLLNLKSKPISSETQAKNLFENHRDLNFLLQQVKKIEHWIKFGLENIDTAVIIEFHKILKEYLNHKEKLDENDLFSSSILETENHKRAKAIQNFILCLEKNENSAKNTFHMKLDLIEKFLCLSEIQRNPYRERFLKVLFPSKNEYEIFKNQITQQTYHIKDLLTVAVCEYENRELSLMMKGVETGLYHNFNCNIENLNKMEDLFISLLNNFNVVSDNKVSKDILTTAAICCRKLADGYRFLGIENKVSEIIDFYNHNMNLNLSKIENFLSEIRNCPLNSSRYVFRGSSELRKRKMKISKKNIDGQIFHELSFELRYSERREISQYINFVSENKKKLQKAVYEAKIGDVYSTSEIQTLSDREEKGLEYVIDLEEGIRVMLGQQEEFYNQYHTVRVRMQENFDPKKLVEVFTRLGLPMVLHPSRNEDIVHELRGRAIAFRYPEKFYPERFFSDKELNKNDISENLNLNPYEKKSFDPLHFSTYLSLEENKVIENDLSQAKISEVSPGHYEYVFPHIRQEAWNGGVRAFGTYINSNNDLKETASTLVKILKGSFMSSSERWANGIKGGCAPVYNFMTGSGNQVFTRILTKNLFESHFDLEKFPIRGPVLALLDPRLAERMPYFYCHDRGGVRNPNFYCFDHNAEGQNLIPIFLGGQMMQERKGFSAHLEHLKSQTFPLNEAMFDLAVGSHYVHKLVVSDEESKKTLIQILTKEGIVDINGLSLENAVIASSHLYPEMIDNYQGNGPELEIGVGNEYV